MALAKTGPGEAAISALAVENLAVERGGRLVLGEVAFCLDAGEALEVTGPNGAGKSTLLRAIAGLLPLRAGRIRLAGASADIPVAERAHYLGHAEGLKAALTAGENLAFAAAALLGAGGLAPGEALAALGLGHVADLPVAYLSAGQRRRVALARLLVARRPLWLLDEPGTALDAAAQDRLAGLMRDHLADGGLIVAAVHAPLGLPGAREMRLGS